MEKLLLKRQSFAFGTFSTLYDPNGNELCKMVERKWNNNQQSISCVPVGTYDLLPHVSPKYGECYVLSCPELGVTAQGPSQRTHCLVHPANLPEQLEGCLAPGKAFGVVSGKWAVVSSRVAFNELMTYLGGKPTQLQIINGQ
ncbi:MAG: DUF5675 family protein [Psychromonas sp.]